MNQPTLLEDANSIIGARIAFVQARWHAGIVDNCRRGFLEHWSRQGGDANRVDIISAPGAFEIPLLARKISDNGGYDAIIASAFVVDGGVYRHDFVAATVIDALMRVQLDTGTPIVSAVLTPHQFHEHSPHEAFYAEHMLTKGAEAAEACRGILANFARLTSAHAA